CVDAWPPRTAPLVQLALSAVLVYGIAGLTGARREVLALRRPTSWWTAAKIGFGIGIGMALLSILLTPLLHPGREQGITPDTWQPEHAAAYVVNGLVITIVAALGE